MEFVALAFERNTHPLVTEDLDRWQGTHCQALFIAVPDHRRLTQCVRAYGRDVPAVDTQLKSLCGEPLAQALPGYQKVQKQILADMPWVPLYNPVQYSSVNPRVTGMLVHLVWTYVYQDWKIK